MGRVVAGLTGLVGFGLIHALDADQIIEDCVDVLGVDRSLVGCAHFFDLRLTAAPAPRPDRSAPSNNR